MSFVEEVARLLEQYQREEEAGNIPACLVILASLSTKVLLKYEQMTRQK